MGNDNSTVYDDVLRTIQERHPELLIPLINEVFHTSYPETIKVVSNLLPFFLSKTFIFGSLQIKKH